jgi:hypothetical protein
MKFREHRGSLWDSMATLVELPDRAALLAHCQRLLDPFDVQVLDSQLRIEPYTYDDRVRWETWIVSIDGYGVIGFTDDGPIKPSHP